MKRFLCVGTVAALLMVWTGCGDTFRPIIIPNPPTFPNPKAAHTVVTISDNGDVTNGSALMIDVSGDVVVSVKDVGLHPVHEVQQTASQVLVVNQSDTTVPQDSLAKLTIANNFIQAEATITLPTSYDATGKVTTAAPNFVATTEPNQAYVLMPFYRPPNPSAPGTVVPSVAVINTITPNNIGTVPVSSNPAADPLAMTETPDQKKLYVAVTGDNAVAAFNTLAGQVPSARPLTGTFNAPAWISARNDSQRVYVLGNGLVSTVDTHLTAGPDQVIDASISVPGASYMWYDVVKNRLYVPNGNQLTIVDVSQSTPQVMANLAIAPLAASSRPKGDVCSTFNPSAVTAAAVTSLPDGSRAYVGSFAGFEVDVAISAATVNAASGTTTYTYSLQGPGTIDLLPGMVITISDVSSSGKTPSDFDGTFSVLSVGGGQFQVANVPTDTYLSGGSGAAPNVCQQVTVVDAGNFSVKPPIAIPGTAGSSFCADPALARIRVMMAAAGDSSRAYLSSCDGGNVNIIDTSTDTYYLNLPSWYSARPPIPPSSQAPPQNPVFMIPGP